MGVTHLQITTLPICSKNRPKVKRYKRTNRQISDKARRIANFYIAVIKIGDG